MDPKSPSEKYLRRGDLCFIYDQSHKHAIPGEPGRYFHPISGRVEICTAGRHGKTRERKHGQGTLAGRFDASYVHVDNAIVDGVRLHDLMDAYSPEIAEIYETLFHPKKSELRKVVIELLGEVTQRNILLINSVEILPAYRGMGLGLATVWEVIRLHSTGCGIAAVKAFPIQFRAGQLSDPEKSDWNKKMGYDLHNYKLEFAQEKVIFHLLKLGFRLVGDEGVMILPTPLHDPIPKEILRWIRGSASEGHR